jgi:hypothetical protein
MKNIIKIALVMLSVLSFSAAQAGVLEVTGSAKASYTIHSSDSSTGKVESAKGLGVANEFNLGASGELDNGWTWKYNINIDTDTTQDDGGLSLSAPFGTIAINISQGGLELSKAAAVTANGDRASDTGYAEGMIEEHTIGDMNSIQYHTPAGILPFGIAAKLAYAPDTTADANASVNKIGGQVAGTFTAVTDVTSAQGSNIGRTMSSYQVTAAPIDGLSIGASYQEFGGVAGATAQGPESGSWYAKYAYGPVTVAYGQAYIAPALGTASTDFIEYFDNNKMSISANVNDNLSVSYSQEQSTANHKTQATTDVELQSSSVAAAYTMGGMTFALALVDHENVGYVANVDAKSTIFNVSMAF